MANNKKLTEVSKPTQFKKGNVPAWKTNPEKCRPGSIRYWLKVFSEMKIDPTDLDNEIKRLLNTKRRQKSEIAKIIALRAYEKTIKKMEPKMCAMLIDNLEGKLVAPTMELPPKKLSETQFATVEEAAAAYLEDSKL